MSNWCAEVKATLAANRGLPGRLHVCRPPSEVEQQVADGALVQFQAEAEMAPNPKLLRVDWLVTDRIRTSGLQHPVQHRHPDDSLSLLGRKAASA